MSGLQCLLMCFVYLLALGKAKSARDQYKKEGQKACNTLNQHFLARNFWYEEQLMSLPSSLSG